MPNDNVVQTLRRLERQLFYTEPPDVSGLRIGIVSQLKPAGMELLLDTAWVQAIWRLYLERAHTWLDTLPDSTPAQRLGLEITKARVWVTAGHVAPALYELESAIGQASHLQLPGEARGRLVRLHATTRDGLIAQLQTSPQAHYIRVWLRQLGVADPTAP